MRNVKDRMASYRNHPGTEPGRCAERVWWALGGPKDPPRQGLPDATAVAKAVPKGKMMLGRAPKGAMVYWDQGTGGHGHVCFARGDGTELSVDVIYGKPGKAGVVPFVWFAANWPSLRYLGWSWYFGAYDTEPKKEEVMPAQDVYDYDYLGKPDTEQVLTRSYTTVDLSQFKPGADGIEFSLEYVNVRPEFKAGETVGGAIRMRLVRSDGDNSWYDDLPVLKCMLDDDGKALFTRVYFELGELETGTKVAMRCQGGLKSAVLSTRYRKVATIKDKG